MIASSGAGSGREPERGPGLWLRRSLEPFAASDGNVYVLATGVESELVVEDASPAQRALLELLAEGVEDVPDLERRLDEQGFDRGSIPVAAVVHQLEEVGLLERPPKRTLAPAAAERYGRQLLYFAQLAPTAHPEDAQARLRDARVVVLGCGGLGSWTLCGLACAGVGSLVLVDPDRVAMSNLNRQLLFKAADVGRPKVAVAAEALAAFNPETALEPVARRVESADDVARLARGADLLIEVADWPPIDIARWVNEACAHVGVPHVSGGQAPPLARIGPLYVPGSTSCHACQEAAAREAFPLFDELEAFRRSRPPATAATLGPSSGLIGSVLAMEAVHWLTGLVEPATLGRGVAIDLRTMQVTVEAVPRRAGCPVCG